MNEITINFFVELCSEEEFNNLIEKTINDAIDNDLLIIHKPDDKGDDE